MAETQDKVSFAERAVALEVEIRNISANLIHLTSRLDLISAQLTAIPNHELRLSNLERDIEVMKREIKAASQTIDRATGGWKIIVGAIGLGAMLSHMFEAAMSFLHKP